MTGISAKCIKGNVNTPVLAVTLIEFQMFIKQVLGHKQHVIAGRKEIAMAGELLLSISKDEQERARYRSKRMFETDRTSNELTIEYRGALKIARNMKTEGLSAEIIAKTTGLSITEISKL